VLWTASGWFLEKFSPDGSKVLGLKSEGGVIVAWAAFDARSGDLERQAAIPAGLEVHQVAWEDDQHLLMSVTQDASTAIVRSDLGVAERATDVAPANGDDYPLAPASLP
jgi:hypothetical protein